MRIKRTDSYNIAPTVQEMKLELGHKQETTPILLLDTCHNKKNRAMI